MATPEPKLCVTCGREMTYRQKWAKNWDEVKYCSDACRRGVTQEGRELEERILQLLARRKAGDTICPSEVAREAAPEEWRELMEPVRRAARRLVAGGQVEVTQCGKVVDAASARGPIRIRLKRG